MQLTVFSSILRSSMKTADLTSVKDTDGIPCNNNTSLYCSAITTDEARTETSKGTKTHVNNNEVTDRLFLQSGNSLGDNLTQPHRIQITPSLCSYWCIAGNNVQLLYKRRHSHTARNRTSCGEHICARTSSMPPLVGKMINSRQATDTIVLTQADLW
jgi:hypothetical protein